MTGIRNTRKKRRAEKNLVDTRIMRSFGETPGKREALLNKLVKISETPVKREETPEKGEEPLFPLNSSMQIVSGSFLGRPKRMDSNTD